MGYMGRAENASMKEEMSKMKKGMSYTTEDDIDKRIRELEYKMCHESIALKEEKAYMNEIKELKKSRTKLADLGQLLNKLANFDAGVDLREQVSKLNEAFST